MVATLPAQRVSHWQLTGRNVSQGVQTVTVETNDQLTARCNEWAAFLAEWQNGATRYELTRTAHAMRDAGNRTTALYVPHPSRQPQAIPRYDLPR